MKAYSIAFVFIVASFFEIEAANTVTNALLIDRSLKILEAGAIANNNTNVNSFLLVRYHPTGILDRTFNPDGVESGTPGVVVTDIMGLNSQVNGLVLDINNKIIAAGLSTSATMSFITIARYNPDGSLDITFNPDGIGSGIPGVALTSVPGFATLVTSVTIDFEGRIIAAGSANNGAFISVLVARYTANGLLDPSFNPPGLGQPGMPGVVITTISSNFDRAQAIVAYPSNKVLIAGFSKSPSTSQFLAIRYNPNGSFDLSFANKGIFLFQRPGSVNDAANGLAIDVTNKIVLGGFTDNGTNTDFATLKLNQNGTFDTTYNPTGAVSGVPGMTEQSIGTNNSQANGVVTDQTNNVVASGFAFLNNAKVFATVRYTPAGALDLSFGGTGVVTTTIEIPNTFLMASSPIAQANAVAIDILNRVITAGFSQGEVQFNVTTVHYNHDGSLNPSFHQRGVQPGILVSTLLGKSQSPLPIGYLENLLMPTTFAFLTPEMLASLVASTEVFAQPVISGEFPLITGTRKFELSGTARPGSFITMIVNDRPLLRTIAGPDGVWHVTLPPLPDGSYSLYVVAEDPFTHFTLASARVDVTINTKLPPPPTITAPVQDALISTTTPLISGTAEPGSAVELFINGRRIGTAIADRTGHWGYSAPVLSEGKYTLYALSTVIATNRSSRSRQYTFTIDTHAFRPPRIVSPVDQLITKNNRPTVTGEARNNASVTLVLNGKAVGVVRANEQGGWSYTFSEPLPDGLYRLTAMALNPANNSPQTSAPITFTIDVAPPKPAVITEVSPLTHAITGRAEPLSTVTLYLDGALFAQVSADALGRWGYTPPSEQVPHGAHTVSVSTTDRAGNASSLVERTVMF